LTTTDLVVLTTSQIQSITPTDVGAMTTSEIASLTTVQSNALLSAQIQYLTSTQISALTTAQVSSLTTAQVSVLLPQQVAGFSVAQLASMTAAEKAALNVVTVQVLADGPLHYIVKASGTLTSANVASFPIVNVATIGLMGAGLLTSKVRIDRIVGDADQGLDVILQWDATQPSLIYAFSGHGHDEYERIGGLPNPNAAGTTGNVLLSTNGWTAGAQLNFSVIIECLKTQSVPQ
jgi:hypothetical protein